MLLMFCGEIFSYDIRERRDKNTGEVTYNLVVNVSLDLVNKEGKKKRIAEDIVLPIEYENLVKENEGKFILIPYNYLSTKDNSFLFVDPNYVPAILDHNPFSQKQIKQKAA